jgi:chromosomal replication initiator protein
MTTAPVSIDRIKSLVAAEFEQPLAVMVSERRTKDEVRARQVAIALSYRLTKRSGSVIGRLFGGRDHSTVAHADRRIAQLCAEDGEFARRVRSIEFKLLPPPASSEVQLAFLLGPLFDPPAMSAELAV